MSLSPFMKTDTPELAPRYERFTVTYPSGTVIESFYASGATVCISADCRARRSGVQPFVRFLFQ